MASSDCSRLDRNKIPTNPLQFKTQSKVTVLALIREVHVFCLRTLLGQRVLNCLMTLFNLYRLCGVELSVVVNSDKEVVFA